MVVRTTQVEFHSCQDKYITCLYLSVSTQINYLAKCIAISIKKIYKNK